MNLRNCQKAEEWFIFLAEAVRNHGWEYIKFCDEYPFLRFVSQDIIYQINIKNINSYLFHTNNFDLTMQKYTNILINIRDNPNEFIIQQNIGS